MNLRDRLLRWLYRSGDDAKSLQAFFDSMQPVKIGENDYTDLDRYKDFNETFNSPHGRRTLHQIIAFAEGRSMTEKDAEQTHRMAFRNGRREVGLWIVQKMQDMPAARNLQAQREPD